jgi:SAM-dependent methyltransferase
VGEAWAGRYAADSHAYRLAGGAPFLRRFGRSPFVRLPAGYARLAPGSRVLEAGCGSGKFSLCFAMLGCEVTALDYSAAALANLSEARRRLEPALGRLRLRLVQGDLERLGLAAGRFDLVINEGVVEHWLEGAERQRVLGAMARAARRGGVVAVIVPNGRHPFMDRWLQHHPGLLSAPPMVRYGPALLAEDLSSAGLADLRVDGIYAWRTLEWWPAGPARRLLGGALQRVCPLPRPLRLRWGIHLIGLGRQP